MNCLLIGKFLETIGAALVAWVAAQACYLEVMVEGPVRIDDGDDNQRSAANSNDSDLAKLRRTIDKINERRRRQFGFWESISVFAGTTAIFVGCALYLIGLYYSEYK